MKTSAYREDPERSRPCRQTTLDQIELLVRERQVQADRMREHFFQPDYTSRAAYMASTEAYRTALRGLLGWPLNDPELGKMDTPAVRSLTVAEDEFGTIQRLWIEALPGLSTYGLLFCQRSDRPLPLVIAQHGALGTPESAAGFHSTNNYNDMVRRIQRRGVVVFAPQLLLWADHYGPSHQKHLLDRSLKQTGGSLAALELFRLSRCLDFLTSLPEVNADRVGMAGLSYGGFYTLFLAALDLRIRVALSSCFVNDRRSYNFEDWVWSGSATRFLDAEVGALICPRALFLEAGVVDEVFKIKGARSEAERVLSYYRKLGIRKDCVYREHTGGHEFSREDHGIDFLCQHLAAE